MTPDGLVLPRNNAVRTTGILIYTPNFPLSHLCQFKAFSRLCLSSAFTAEQCRDRIDFRFGNVADERKYQATKLLNKRVVFQYKVSSGFSIFGSGQGFPSKQYRSLVINFFPVGKNKVQCRSSQHPNGHSNLIR